NEHKRDSQNHYPDCPQPFPGRCLRRRFARGLFGGIRLHMDRPVIVSCGVLVAGVAFSLRSWMRAGYLACLKNWDHDERAGTEPRSAATLNKSRSHAAAAVSRHTARPRCRDLAAGGMVYREAFTGGMGYCPRPLFGPCLPADDELRRQPDQAPGLTSG